MMARIPGSPRAHVWVGLVLATIGIAVGGYAYTGPRAYRFEFIFVALLGFLLLAGGSLLTGYGQANRPRMGKPKRTKRAKGEARSKASKADREAPDEAKDATRSGPAAHAGQEEPHAEEGQAEEGQAEKAPWTQRLTGWIPGLGRADEVQATVACPACQHVFETRGQVPYEIVCPNCAHPGQIEEPQEVEMTAGAPPVIDADPASSGAQPSSEDPSGAEDQEPPEATPSPEREQGAGLATRTRDRVARLGAKEITATVACSHCEHVFTVTGTPPFQTTCPSCAYTGRVDAQPS